MQTVIHDKGVCGSQNQGNTYLKATIMWPLLETGFAFSRYAVKLSSRQRTSGWVEPAGKDGERGEFGVAWDAVATMPHIGQPGFDAKAMKRKEQG
jgi:hypothetical protein